MMSFCVARGEHSSQRHCARSSGSLTRVRLRNFRVALVGHKRKTVLAWLTTLCSERFPLPSYIVRLFAVMGVT
jgi:hypothetical protein